MLRISHSVHYHPLFVYSSYTVQSNGSASVKEKKKEMNGRCGCLTFKSPRHLFY